MAHEDDSLKKKMMKYLKDLKQKRKAHKMATSKKYQYRRDAEQYYKDYIKKHGVPSDLPEEEEIDFYGGGGYMKPKYKGGGKLGKKKKLDFNGDGKITKADFIMMAKAKMKRKGKK